MQDSKEVRLRLMLELGESFKKDLTKSLVAFSDSEKIQVCDALIEFVKLSLEGQAKELLEKQLIAPLVEKYKSKFKEFFTVKLTEYFAHDLIQLFGLQRTHTPPVEQVLFNEEEVSQCLRLFLHELLQQKFDLLVHLPHSNETEQNQLEEALTEQVLKHVEHTARRKVLFMYYLNKEYKFSQDKKPLSEITHFLTGHNEDNLYKFFRSPLGEPPKLSQAAQKALLSDLLYVKGLFERLKHVAIVAAINKDIASL